MGQRAGLRLLQRPVDPTLPLRRTPCRARGWRSGRGAGAQEHFGEVSLTHSQTRKPANGKLLV